MLMKSAKSFPMTDTKPFCFVIMPFVPELNYFYLYFKRHIEENHNIRCERADAKILTVPFLDKIIDYIKNSDVLIADCTDRNPNVFYELGIAHALGKKVILITKDELRDAPADVRHFEFIKYDLSNDTDFLNRLDNALRHVFVTRYAIFYSKALQIFDEFNRETGTSSTPASEEIFMQRLAVSERTQGLPEIEDILGITELVLPKIISDSSDIRIMSKVTGWITRKFDQ